MRTLKHILHVFDNQRMSSSYYKLISELPAYNTSLDPCIQNTFFRSDKNNTCNKY